MKQIAFLAMVLAVCVPGVYSQPDEIMPSLQDSLQVLEEDEIPVEETPAEEITAEETPAEEITAEEIPAEEITAEEIPDEEIPDEEIPDENEIISSDPSSVLHGFFQALKTGDGFLITQLISSDGLENIEVMLEILNENIDDNEEITMSRLTTAGYTATAEEIDDWSPIEYLTNTIVLPVMKARYSLYEMQIGDYSISGNELIVPLVFSTSSGVELPYEAILAKENDQWKVTIFMGLNSFP